MVKRKGKAVFVYRAGGQLVLSLSRLRQPVSVITEAELEEINARFNYSNFTLIHGGLVLPDEVE